MYGANISAELIPQVTNGDMETVTAWQNYPLLRRPPKKILLLNLAITFLVYASPLSYRQPTLFFL